MNGDIYYVDVTPHDSETFCVTASTHGFFLNKVGEKDLLMFEKISLSLF